MYLTGILTYRFLIPFELGDVVDFDKEIAQGDPVLIWETTYKYILHPIQQRDIHIATRSELNNFFKSCHKWAQWDLSTEMIWWKKKKEDKK